MVTTDFGVDNCAILTAPSMSEGSIQGKQLWIDKYYPQFRQRVIFATAKEFLAGPERILIDDRDKNVDVFHANGGAVILVPRLWNRRHPEADHSLTVVRKELNALQYNR